METQPRPRPQEVIQPQQETIEQTPTGEAIEHMFGIKEVVYESGTIFKNSDQHD